MDVSFAKKLQEQYNKINDVDTTNTKSSYDNVSVKAESVEYVAEVEEAIQALGFADTYSMESIRKPLEQQMSTIQMILGGLGAISLLVAALGITNTMIMSIYERTREIGVMKVLGCVVGNIRTMFLVEAGTIGFMGASWDWRLAMAYRLQSTPSRLRGIVFLWAGSLALGSLVPMYPLSPFG